ncbi:MAG: hypothetical protein AAF990_08775, partial [Bacteroidota bacterium]
FPIDIILRSSTRGITSGSFSYSIANIPDCIFDEGLTVKAEFSIEVIEPDGSTTPVSRQTGYAEPPDANGISFVMTIDDWPAAGQVRTITTMKVVRPGDECCDLPFFPPDVQPGDPANNKVYSDFGCCFFTTCCECFPHEPPLIPQIKNHMLTQLITWVRNASPPPVGFLSTYNARTQCSCCTW